VAIRHILNDHRRCNASPAATQGLGGLQARQAAREVAVRERLIAKRLLKLVAVRPLGRERAPQVLAVVRLDRMVVKNAVHFRNAIRRCAGRASASALFLLIEAV